MASHGSDQFHLILTSDGGSEIYVENKTSNFKIDLADPIIIGEEKWEVALLSISYPKTWVNIGDAAGVYMSYRSAKSGVQEVTFPNWQCQSLTELEDFIASQIQSTGKKLNDDSKLIIKLDELGRVKIWCNEPGYDIGFSDNMLRVLGLIGHSRMFDLRMEAFSKRQHQRLLIDSLCVKKPFAYTDAGLRQSIRVCKDVDIFEGLMDAYLDDSDLKYDQLYHMYVKDARSEECVENLCNAPREIAYLDPEKDSSRSRKMLALLLLEMQNLLIFEEFPQTIRGVIPGVLDPIQRMFIYLNILDDIDMNNTTSKILKVANTRGEPMKMTQEDFTNPIYLPVQKGRHNMLHVYIKNDQGENVPFQSGTVLMILHFRRKAK